MLGVLLVLVSVVVGARVLSAADRSTLVWAVTRDVAPGTALRAGDLELARARLFDAAGRYASGPRPEGYVTQRGLGAGELLPVAALRRPEVEVDFRYVTVPVLPGHLPPDLDRGQQVDVWVTPGRDAGTAGSSPAPAADPTAGRPAAGSRLVLPGVAVFAKPAEAAFGGGSTERPVVLTVRPDAVALLVRAMAEGRIDLVRVAKAGEVPDGLTGSGGPSAGTSGGPSAGTG